MVTRGSVSGLCSVLCRLWLSAVSASDFLQLVMEVVAMMLLLQPALPSAGVWQYPAFNAPLQGGDPPSYNAPLQRGAPNPAPTRATRAAMPQDLVSG